MQNLHSLQSLLCPVGICPERLDNLQALLVHIETNHGDAVLQHEAMCSFGSCKERFEDINLLLDHLNWHNRDPAPIIVPAGPIDLLLPEVNDKFLRYGRTTKRPTSPSNNHDDSLSPLGKIPRTNFGSKYFEYFPDNVLVQIYLLTAALDLASADALACTCNRLATLSRREQVFVDLLKNMPHSVSYITRVWPRLLLRSLSSSPNSPLPEFVRHFIQTLSSQTQPKAFFLRTASELGHPEAITLLLSGNFTAQPEELEDSFQRVLIRQPPRAANCLQLLFNLDRAGTKTLTDMKVQALLCQLFEMSVEDVKDIELLRTIMRNSRVVAPVGYLERMCANGFASIVDFILSARPGDSVQGLMAPTGAGADDPAMALRAAARSGSFYVYDRLVREFSLSFGPEDYQAAYDDAQVSGHDQLAALIERHIREPPFFDAPAI